nr:hypothetical protein [Streptomyces sp. NRRL S-813]
MLTDSQDSSETPLVGSGDVWRVTVFSLIESFSTISWLRRPLAGSARTPSSRGRNVAKGLLAVNST